MRFEKGVIARLAKSFPDLKDHLMNIYDHMKDLMIPFRDRNYYTKEMQGSYSIKYVLPALFPEDPSLNYHNLEEVHNGDEAMKEGLASVELNEKIEPLENLHSKCNQIKAQKNIKMVKRKLSEYLSNNKYGGK